MHNDLFPTSRREGVPDLGGVASFCVGGSRAGCRGAFSSARAVVKVRRRKTMRVPWESDGSFTISPGFEFRCRCSWIPFRVIDVFCSYAPSDEGVERNSSIYSFTTNDRLEQRLMRL